MQRDEGYPKLYLRWTRNERIQHWILAVTFFVLVITGFALKFPESWWTWPFIITGSIDLRGLLHRIAATIYIFLSLYHLGYLIFTVRGRAQFRAFMLRIRDFLDLVTQVQHNLGKSVAAPQYGHFTYWEKIEYWSLLWGTLIMASTGLILWFESISLRIFPLWVIDVATVIHLYEAILATLAILIWHFYFVIFDPMVYPLNLSMLDGYISESEMEEEHKGELETMKQQIYR